MGAVELIDRQNLETKNRISLILLDKQFRDSSQRIHCSPYRFVSGKPIRERKISLRLFARRQLVIDEVKSKIRIPKELLEQCQALLSNFEKQSQFTRERRLMSPSAMLKAIVSVVQKILKDTFRNSIVSRFWVKRHNFPA